LLVCYIFFINNWVSLINRIFNEWELKGIPIRIEIGPKDIEKGKVIVFRRDNQKKEEIIIKDLKKTFGAQLSDAEREYLDSVYGAMGSMSQVERKIAIKKNTYPNLTHHHG
jgi:prolyl-tRNA synthetase